MKWIQIILTLFLLLSLPLFQMDQAVDIDWLVCENSLFIKLEINGSFFDPHLWIDSIPKVTFFNQVTSFFQLKNPLSALPSYFQGSSPFWRPPPGF